MSLNDKHQILDEIDAVLGEKQDLSVSYLLGVLLLVSLVILLAFPKIFLRNSIYYKSREISSLQRQYKSLKEEHKIIKNQVEKKKFKNQILDTLF